MKTKIAIIEKKVQESKLDLSPSVTHYIASHVESNIRELEGFLIRISAYSSLTNRQIDLDLVREVLKKIVKHNNKEEVSTLRTTWAGRARRSSRGSPNGSRT